MDLERYAEKRLEEAIASGDMTPTVGVGEPITDLTDDPDWWLRALFERERLPERHDEFRSHVRSALREATHANDLVDARRVLSAVNHEIATWNAQSPEKFRVAPRSEVWLVTERARVPEP